MCLCMRKDAFQLQARTTQQSQVSGMIKKIVLVAALAVTTVGAGLALSSAANAGEGHWSVGKGVQCKIVNGVVVCSKSRP